jgi:hypothetical protein
LLTVVIVTPRVHLKTKEAFYINGTNYCTFKTIDPLTPARFRLNNLKLIVPRHNILTLKQPEEQN